MADKKLVGAPSPSLSSPSHQNGGIGGTGSKSSPQSHHNGSLEGRPGYHSPSNIRASPQPQSTPSRSPASTSPFRTLLGRMTPASSPCPDGSSPRPRGQSLASALSARVRASTPRSKRRSSQQEEPEALLDLILECQGQRLDDQRASVSLLPDPEAAGLCGACSPEQPSLPSLDFYYMLIHYQSDRMEDQRCSLPDLEDVVGTLPEGQDDFFSLIQRVQSRRMDEQRASLLMAHTEEDASINPASSSPRNHHLHHHQHPQL